MAGGNLGSFVNAKLKGDILSFPVKANTTIYRGAPVALDSTGYLVMASDTSGLYFQGIAEEGVAAADVVAGTTRVRVRRHGIFKMRLANAAAIPTVTGARIFMHTAQGSSTDYLVDTVSNVSNGIFVGTCVKHGADSESVGSNSTEVWVDITPSTYPGQLSTTAPYQLPLSEFRKPDAIKDVLSDTGTGTYLGLADDPAAYALTTSAVSSGTATRSASFIYTVPSNYKAGTNITVRIRAKVDTVPGTSATLSATFKAISDGGLGSNLVTTSAQNLTTSYVDYDFTVNGASLTPGALCILTVTIAITTSSAVTGTIAKVEARPTCWVQGGVTG